MTGQLIEARNGQERVALLTSFLVARLKQEKPRDTLVEESLRLIHANIGSLHVKDLLDTFHLSERQFERRFTQTVGLTPHVYLRVKRFNAAIRLIKTRRFERLADVAAALNFADQSHFVNGQMGEASAQPYLPEKPLLSVAVALFLSSED